MDLLLKLIDNVAYVQKHWGKDMTGQRKKELVMNRMNVYVRSIDIDDLDKQEALDFLDNYCGDFIDVLIMVCRNKQLTKLFKRKCGCFPSRGRTKETEELIDSIL